MGVQTFAAPSAVDVGVQTFAAPSAVASPMLCDRCERTQSQNRFLCPLALDSTSCSKFQWVCHDWLDCRCSLALLVSFISEIWLLLFFELVVATAVRQRISEVRRRGGLQEKAVGHRLQRNPRAQSTAGRSKTEPVKEKMSTGATARVWSLCYFFDHRLH